MDGTTCTGSFLIRGNFKRNNKNIYQRYDDDIRRLIQLFDNIPDYYDINHLNEEEFYNTIETLKRTSDELREHLNSRCPSVDITVCDLNTSPVRAPSVKKFKTKKKSRKSILANDLKIISDEIDNDIFEIVEENVKSKRESHLSNSLGISSIEQKGVLHENNVLNTNERLIKPINDTFKRFDSESTTAIKTKEQEDFEEQHQVPRSSSEKSTSKNLSKIPGTSNHAVPRANHAAMLRLECSKKKLKQLVNNLHQHSSSIMDWEVRKTPTWRALTLSESHEKKLAERLAIRKVEQDLLKKEYEHNMEIMRQRVKSSPLLFERTSYWNSAASKIKNNCSKIFSKRCCLDRQSNHENQFEKMELCKCHKRIFTRF